jgi:AcrR family transcriptional regulator
MPRLRPMMTEWKMMPNSRIRNAAICCLNEHSRAATSVSEISSVAGTGATEV